MTILTTNIKRNIDKSFLRRFRFAVDFPFPSAKARLQIWKMIFPKEAEVDKLDCNELSQLKVTGGTIKNIALNAAFLAAAEGKPVMMSHIRNVISGNKFL